MLFQFFAVIRDIPGRQRFNTMFFLGESLQLLQFALRMRTGARSQIGQKINHLFGGVRHLGGQRTFGIIRKTQQLCQFVA